MSAVAYIARSIITFLAIGGLATCVVVDNQISGDAFAIGVFGALLVMAFAWLIDTKKSKVDYKHLLLQLVSWVAGYVTFFAIFPYLLTFVESLGGLLYILTFAFIAMTMMVFSKHIDAAEKRGDAGLFQDDAAAP